MKMIGKLNEKDLKINKKQMILWMGGILAAVILLMVFIVKVEPPAEGISRQKQPKPGSGFEDPQTLEDMASERENSSFTDKEKGNWFVKYMDYLYEKGYLDDKVTPASLTSAQGNLTYEDVNAIAQKLSPALKKQVGMTRWNKKKTFSKNSWWDLYKDIVKENDKEGKSERSL